MIKIENDIIFLGLAQNCEKFLPKIFGQIDKIAEKKKVKVFIGENSSNDSTFDIIQKKILSSQIYNFVDTSFIEKFEDRIKRLAHARQILKQTIINLKIKAKYVCIIDLDDVINETFNENLINNLSETLDKNKYKYFGISVAPNHIIMIF